MRAAVFTRFGGPEVVGVLEVPAPAPGPGQVLVRVVAAGVNASDSRLRSRRVPRGFGPLVGLAFGVRRPRRTILGGSFSGVVEAVGRGAEEWRPGDEVVGTTGMALGAHAELVAVPARRLVAKPAGVTHSDAAAVVFGGTAALWFVRDLARVGAGTTVLVLGAGGAVGTAAVQLAALAGGVVTAVSAGANTGLLTGLGAARVLDRHSVDLATLPDRFDVVLDAAGALDLRSGRRLLAPGGLLLLAVADLKDTLLARGNARAGSAPERAEDVAHLLDLVATGRLKVVIEEELPLAAIAAAHARVDSGRKVGNLVVRP